jgi:hypothetical protein
MLSEVASLDAATTDTGDALAETLDTDKLLAEVGSMEAAGSEAAPEAAPVATPETPPDDDLLAEFKDTKKSS